MPGPVAGDREDGALLWMVAQPGLSRSVLGYLYRNRVHGEAVMVARRGGGSAFGGDAAGSGQRLLVRVRDLPERMLDLFASVPGIALFRPVEGAPNVVVELGYRHPLRLESCLALFERRYFYLFAGRADAVEVLTEAVAGGDAPEERPDLGRERGALHGDDPLPLAAIDRLVSTNLALHVAEPRSAAHAPAPSQRITLRLVPSSVMAPGGGGDARGERRAIAGVLVAWERAAWLKRLVFALPPPLVAACRAAAIEDGLLVVAESGAVDRLPIGELLYEAAPSVLVPVGFELSPRVTAEVLTNLVGGAAGRRIVLRSDARHAGGPVRAIAVDDATFEPLSRRLLAQIPSSRATVRRACPSRRPRPPRPW